MFPMTEAQFTHRVLLRAGAKNSGMLQDGDVASTSIGRFQGLDMKVKYSTICAGRNGMIRAANASSVGTYLYSRAHLGSEDLQAHNSKSSLLCRPQGNQVERQARALQDDTERTAF